MDKYSRVRTRMSQKKHKRKKPVIWLIAAAALTVFLVLLFVFILPGIANTNGAVPPPPERTESAVASATAPAPSAVSTPALTPAPKPAPESAPIPTTQSDDTAEPAITPGATEIGPGQFTIVWMSDSQFYSEDHPEVFYTMTEWIADNKQAYDIRYVIHTGDFVDDYDDPDQWANAKKGLDTLKGKLPLMTVAGNHDYDPDLLDYSAYLALVDSQDFPGLSTFGGFYKDGQGRYDLLDVNDSSFLILSMGAGIDQPAADWMNKILKEYPNRTAILCVHGFITPDGTLTNDGSFLNPEVVERNPNVKLVLCGHEYGVNHFESELDDNGDGKPDRTVYQIVADYQCDPLGGNGYLYLMTFDSRKNEIAVTSYSPYLDDFVYHDDAPKFEKFTIPMDF